MIYFSSHCLVWCWLYMEIEKHSHWTVKFSKVRAAFLFIMQTHLFHYYFSHRKKSLRLLKWWWIECKMRWYLSLMCACTSLQASEFQQQSVMKIKILEECPSPDHYKRYKHQRSIKGKIVFICSCLPMLMNPLFHVNWGHLTRHKWWWSQGTEKVKTR